MGTEIITKRSDGSSDIKKYVGGVILCVLIGIYALSQTRVIVPLNMSQVSTLKHTIHQKLQQIHAVLKGDNSTSSQASLSAGVVGAEMGWTPYMDIVDEETALRDPPITDIKTGVSIKNSRVYILGHSNEISVGDTVRLRIDLYDGYGKRRQKWGDQLRVRIFEESLGASAAGYVVDHKNGSYTAIVKCLWVGNPTILVFMSYSREAVRALYHIRKQLLATRVTYIIYTNNERQPCHPLAKRLGNPQSLCDMTPLNGHMSWYCRAPTNYSCSLKQFILKNPYPALPITEAESALFARNMEHLAPSLQIKIKGSRLSSNDSQKPRCALFNRTALWFQPSPVGHFMNNIWEPLHCRGPTSDKYKTCLRNKHILFYGDSTVRQWFGDIKRRFNCVLSSETWTQDKWKKDSAAYCKDLNLTIEWVVHSFPGNIDKTRVHIHSTAENMLKFANNKNAIFVIHLLCHLSAYHHDVFRDRISHIRQSVEAVLKESKDAKILIKGGHTFRDFRQVSDYYSYVYRTIEIEEFKGLYDKVIYLDNKDMTNAQEVIPNHPNDKVVREMVNQMLYYICT